MFLRCPCSHILTDAASPGSVEHRLLTGRGIELLQDSADGEVAQRGTIEQWPEHFDTAGAIDVWVCPKCLRIFVYATGPCDRIIVYHRESVGLPAAAVGPDSKLGAEEDVVGYAFREHSGDSPLTADRGR